MDLDDLYESGDNASPENGEQNNDEAEKENDGYSQENDYAQDKSDAQNSVENEQRDIYSSEQTSYIADSYTAGPETPEKNTPDNGYSYSNPYRNPYQNQSRNQSQNRDEANYNPYRQTNYSSYSQPSGGYGGYGSMPEKPKKGSAGKKIVAAVLAVIVIAASIGIGTAIGRNSAATPSVGSSEVSTTGDNYTLEIKPQESTVTETGIDNVRNARDSVVGVLVYDASGSLAGEGSGVVMGTNDAGTKTYVITCAHVVSEDSVKSCAVLLADGTTYDAEIVGYDERTDIGVLSVKETTLKSAVFGDSTALEVTDTVYAIGNPGGSEFYGSITDGIVSALDRSITSTYTMTVIQHTAAISPGNSGGALVNSQGQVVGINSSKIAATDYEGIGFAVPVSVAKPIVDSIIKHGYVPNRPKLGISYASVSQYQAYSMVVSIKGLPKGSVIIASIADDSSFKDTDVQVGDMITEVNGKKLTKSDVLLDVIDKANVGDKLKLHICRINARTYAVSEFDVTVALVEDKGSFAQKDKEETTSQNYYDYYYGNGNDGFGDFGNFEDFFERFFGN